MIEERAKYDGQEPMRSLLRPRHVMVRSDAGWECSACRFLATSLTAVSRHVVAFQPGSRPGSA